MDKHDHHSGGFGNGFLLGLIVGAAIIFFLFTKRGRQLLKVISEEGFEGIEELKEILDYEDFDEETEEKETKQSPTVEKVESIATGVTKTAKRFFKGVPKKR